MNKLKEIFGGDTRQFGMIFALVFPIVLFQVLTDGLTLDPGNVINIFQGNSYILVMAIGMVLVIIAGHIDLSVGSVAAFAGIVVAIAMRDWGIPWFVGILLGLVIGALLAAALPAARGIRTPPAAGRSPSGMLSVPVCRTSRQMLQNTGSSSDGVHPSWRMMRAIMMLARSVGRCARLPSERTRRTIDTTFSAATASIPARARVIATSVSRSQ